MSPTVFSILESNVKESGHLYRTLSSTHCSSSLTFTANLEKGGSKGGGAKAVWMNVHATFLQLSFSCVEEEGGFSKKREISWAHNKDANITC